ncbi:MAG: hypothetical protein ACI4R9_08390 [Kiritimatiellia bacterium]
MGWNSKAPAAGGCPVTAYASAPEGYAGQVATWLANPHAYFTSFGPAARAFQKRNPSPRLRTMTLVAPAAEFVGLRPVQLSVDGVAVPVGSWEDVFVQALTRLSAVHVETFVRLQGADELAWLGCSAGGPPVTALLESGSLSPEFSGLAEVVGRVQWLFLMCGIRLNEVIVQVDPYTDEEWKVRAEEIRTRRAADRAFLEGRRAAQKAWAEAHPEDAAATPRTGVFL